MSLFYSAGLGGTAIPDSGLLHDYEGSNFDGTTWTDQEGTADLTAVGGPTSDTFNGEPAVFVDGTDDGFDSGLSEVQPLIYFFVISPSGSGIERLFSTPSTEANFFAQQEWGNRFTMAAPNFPKGTPGPSTGQFIYTYSFDGANSYFERNDTTIISGDAGQNDPANQEFFYSSEFGEYLKGTCPRIMVYNKNNISSVSEVKTYLNDTYNVY